MSSIERFNTPVLETHEFTRRQQIVYNIASGAKCPILLDFPPGEPPNLPPSHEELIQWETEDCILFHNRIYSRTALKKWIETVQTNERNGLLPTSNVQDRTITSITRDGENFTMADVTEAPHQVTLLEILQFARLSSGEATTAISLSEVQEILEEDIGFIFHEMSLTIKDYASVLKDTLEDITPSYEAFVTHRRNNDPIAQGQVATLSRPRLVVNGTNQANPELPLLPDFHTDRTGQALLRTLLITARQWPPEPDDPTGPSGYARTIAHGQKTSWLGQNLPFFFLDGIFQGYRPMTVPSFMRRLAQAEQHARGAYTSRGHQDDPSGSLTEGDVPLYFQEFFRFFDWKANQPSATRQRAQLRAIERSVIGQQPPLGNANRPMRDSVPPARRQRGINVVGTVELGNVETPPTNRRRQRQEADGNNEDIPTDSRPRGRRHSSNLVSPGPRGLSPNNAVLPSVNIDQIQESLRDMTEMINRGLQADISRRDYQDLLDARRTNPDYLPEDERPFAELGRQRARVQSYIILLNNERDEYAQILNSTEGEEERNEIEGLLNGIDETINELRLQRSSLLLEEANLLFENQSNSNSNSN